ncbi:MAG: transcriptional repressor [Bacteroidales bacterium]|nr:transcriptional repressor [Bacteroidales bacterium]
MRKGHKRRPADLDTFSRMLETYGLKLTPQRLAVHKAMLGMIHADADSVYEAVKAGAECRIARSTVYNILSGLADKGIYARRYSCNGRIVFDINAWRHLHLYDSVTGEFVDVEADDLLQEVSAGLTGHRFRGYHIDDIDIQIICRPTKRRKA